MSNPQVCIVMATYNGSEWLGEQISSIQSQKYREWTLLVSDDGSTDDTVRIVQKAAKKDERIQLLTCRGGLAGHVANFEYLLEAALQLGAKSIFLADQDDIWELDKLGSMLSLASTGGETPMVVFSDMKLIDASGDALGSFMASMGSIEELSIDELLRQNYLAGCSMLVNSRVLELALPFPDKLQNHDWWLGLCAVVSSKLEYCPEELVRYRQHSGNTIGGGTNALLQLRKIWPRLKRQRRVFESKITATRELRYRLRQKGAAVPASLEAYLVQLGGANGWRRILALASSEFKPRSKGLYLAQLLALSPFVRGD